MCGSRGGGGGGGGRWSGPRPLLKNHRNIGFHSNSGPDPLKKHKATKSALNVGPLAARTRNRHLNFKWRFAGGPMLVRILWYLDPLSSQQLKKKKKPQSWTLLDPRMRR